MWVKDVTPPQMILVDAESLDATIEASVQGDVEGRNV